MLDRVERDVSLHRHTQQQLSTPMDLLAMRRWASA